MRCFLCKTKKELNGKKLNFLFFIKYLCFNLFFSDAKSIKIKTKLNTNILDFDLFMNTITNELKTSEVFILLSNL